MKTEYKYISFEQEKNSQDEWYISNNKSSDVLGFIAYYPMWRQFAVTSFVNGCVFNNSCLLDIADFLQNLNKAKRQGER